MGGAPRPNSLLREKPWEQRLDIAWVHKEEGTTLRARVFFFFCGASRPHLI